MKKNFAVLVLVLLGLLLVKGRSIKAEEFNMSNDLPIGINYLDLRYFEAASDGTGYFSKEIEIIPNQIYTLVASKQFVGRVSLMALGDHRIVVSDINNNAVNNLVFMNEHPGFFSVTFKMNINHIRLKGIPCKDFSNDDIMLVNKGIMPGDLVQFQDYLGARGNHPNLEGYVYSDVSNPIDLSKAIKAINILDSDSVVIDTPKVVVENNFSSNSNKLGTYLVVIELDIPNKTTFYHLYVRVVDINEPLLNIPDQIAFASSEEITLEKIREHISYSDNHNQSNELTLEIDLRGLVLSNLAVGSYTISVSVSDISGNIGTKEVELLVYNEISVDFPGRLYFYLSIDDEPLTEEFLIAEFAKKGAGSVVITRNNYNMTREVGVYTVEVETFSTTGQENYIAVIHIVDDTIPEIDGGELILSFDEANRMNRAEIEDWLTTKLKEIVKNFRNLLIEHSEYDESKPAGEYNLYYSYEANKTPISAKMKINVIPSDSPNIGVIILSIVAGVLFLGGGAFAVVKYVKTKKVIANEQQ